MTDLFGTLTQSLGETLYMVSLTTLFSIVLGLPIGVILVICSENNIAENKAFYKVLDFIVNILRSFPFIILLIILIPLTRLIVGTSIGPAAAVVSLSIAAAPFVARIVESSLKEIDHGIIEAAQAMGASKLQIIFSVMLREALPSLILGLTLTIINIIGYTAMAGVIGGGGLGDTAYRFGYQGFDTQTLIYTCIILVVLVELIQSIGNLIANLIIKKRNR